MASGSEPNRSRRSPKRPLLESGRLIVYSLVGSSVITPFVYLAFEATPFEALMAHIGFLSIVTYLVFGIDKWKARSNGRRASEFNLLVLGALGGAAGGLLAMATLRHKIHRNIFRIGFPTLSFIHAVFIALVLSP